MSRAYAMSVVVEEISTDEVQTIDELLEMECGTENKGYVFEGTYQSDFDINLCGGEGEDEFVDRISASIWKAIGKYRPITVTATYLEDLPYEEYPMDEDDYKRLIS